MASHPSGSGRTSKQLNPKRQRNRPYEENRGILFSRVGFVGWLCVVASPDRNREGCSRPGGAGLKSQQTNNVDLLIPLLADKFIDTFGDGKVTGKKEAIAMAKSTKWTSAEYVDLKVSAYGDAAVATGTFKGKGTDGSGKPLDLYERWTDTWVKMSDGKWQCVASQGTP